MGMKRMHNGTLPRRALAVMVTVAAMMAVLSGIGDPSKTDSLANEGASGADAWALMQPEGVMLAVDPEEESVARARMSSIDVAGLEQRVLHAPHDQPVALPLFDNVAFSARTRRVIQQDKGQLTWVADLEGIFGGHIIVSMHDGVAHGIINAPGHGLFEFHPMPLPPDADREAAAVAPEQYIIREIDASRLPPCGVAPEHCVQTPERQMLAGADRHRHRALSEQMTDGHGGVPAPDAATAGDDPYTLRLMVAYTPASRNAVGGTSAMLSLINNTVAQTNEAFQNSLINIETELVHTHETNLNGSGDIITDLNRITGVNNGLMDEVHDLRAIHQADLVALLVTNSSNACGVAWCMTNPSVNFAPNGFSVTRIQCISNLTFPHELGHNMGCHHDHQNSGGNCGSFSYSFGHRYFTNFGQQYRTILAYSPGQRITYFSNPDVNAGGQPTGVPIGSPNEAHNAQTINFNAPIVTSFADQFEPPPPPDPPDNNECADRIPVTDGTTSFSNTDAGTTGPDEPALCDIFDNTQIQKDIWYEYTATCTGEMTVSLCGSFFPTKFGIYEGTSCPTQPNTITACDTISCSSNTFSEISMPVSEGESFIIRIGGRIDQTGLGTLDISCDDVASVCPEDLTDSGAVDTEDLFELLAAWGSCPGCDADLNGDDVVDTEDLFELLGAWGACP